MRSRRGTLSCLVLVIILGSAASASADEGVIEINQAAALAGGIVPGDAAGFPVTISTGTFGTEPMSFRLTGPLFFSGGGNAIEIVGDNVTIDLNGFAIKCTLPGPSGQCTGNGISGVAESENITIRNGSIDLMNNGILLLGKGARVERVRAFRNHADGIHLDDDCTVIDSSANNNGGNGILVASGCVIQGNTANNNGVSTNEVDGDGICTNSGCVVTGNTVRNNRGRGLNLASGTGYSNNVILGNTAGTVINGTPTGQNLCNSVTTCP